MLDQKKYGKEEKVQKGKEEDKAYSRSTLPKITFINLDGYDSPFNLELLKDYKSFQYISIYNEDLIA